MSCDDVGSDSKIGQNSYVYNYNHRTSTSLKSDAQTDVRRYGWTDGETTYDGITHTVAIALRR